MDARASPAMLLTMAKNHLGLSPSAPSTSVPKTYLDELKTHLDILPHDTLFKISLEPKKGYGKVTCLESGCNAESFLLGQNIKIPDGGKRDGIGSLANYRYHIANHPTHAKARLARIRGGATPPSTARLASRGSLSAVKKEPSTTSLMSLLDAGSSFQSPSAGRNSPAATPPSIETKPLLVARARPRSSLQRLYSSPMAKSEPADAVIPKKRSSDVANNEPAQALQSDHASFSGVSGAKRIKTDPALIAKAPLALVNSNSATSVVAAQPPAPAVDVENLRFRISATQQEISSIQALLDRVKRKKNKLKGDLTRMAKYEAQLAQLRHKRDEYTALIPSVKRTLSYPNVVAKREPQAPVLPPAFNALNRSVAANAFPPLPALSTGNQVKVKPEQSLLPPAFSNPMFGRKPVVQPPQPVASGSNIRLKPKPEAFDSDVEMPSDEEAAAAAVMARVGSAIPHIAPLAGAENFDANGDFHGRGRDTFQGPQARADDIDNFLKNAGNAEAFDGNAKVEDALERLGIQHIFDLLPGMEVALMPHQAIGVAWMLDKEKSTFKGGCLGDDMGLGKTVQMIAVLIKNRSEDPLCKTNLIVAPTALLDQWKLEIELKTNDELKCVIYHGSTKPKTKKELLKYDVVLTTYNTMSLEWPDREADMKAKMKKKKKTGNDFIVSDSDDSDVPTKVGRKKRKESGLLFQVDFYRIVLDEAQSIRNKRTRMSRACTDLRSNYRWCLTGTPIINGLADTYGYIRFLKIRPWYDWSEFHGHVSLLEKKNPSLAVVRLQAILNTFLLRRMKDTELDGKRLIELPPKKIEMHRLEFMQEERDIYAMVETRTQARFNRYLRAGTVLKNYAQVLVLLLRLRQICSHPSLIQEEGVAFIAPDEVYEDSTPVHRDELIRARMQMGPEFVSKLRQKFKESALQRIQDEKESADATADDEECPICFDAFTDAVITPCGHLFCRECIDSVISAPAAEAGNNDDPKLKANERPCPACRSPVCKEKIFIRAAFEPSDEDLFGDPKKDADGGDDDVKMLDDTPKAKGKGKAVAKKTKGKKRAAKLRILDSDDIVDDIETDIESDEEDDDDDLDDFIVQSDEDEEDKDARRVLRTRSAKSKVITVIDSDDEIEEAEEADEVIFGRKKKPQSKGAIKLMPRFLPSTKMKWMMDCLRQLSETKPEEKTLIVSQWTSCLQLVSDYLSENGIRHVKFQGDMNRVKRDQAVRTFMANDKARVMLMSLKCGGVGLNLTRANNVISLDLGWSQAIEAQAFDRVHRLGQTRDVEVHRLVITNTVEDRVLEMQERKQNLADGSLGEGKGKKIGKLSVRELANLFGLDHRGRVLEN